jgi:hypothetical protein
MLIKFYDIKIKRNFAIFRQKIRNFGKILFTPYTIQNFGSLGEISLNFNIINIVALLSSI